MSASGGAGAVTIQGFAYAPASLNVKAGQKVTWDNADWVTHTVTADAGAFDSNDLASGASFSSTFRKAGSYACHCEIHSSMHGTIVVW